MSVFALFLFPSLAAEGAAERRTMDGPSWRLERGHKASGETDRRTRTEASTEQLLNGESGVKEKYDDWGVECIVVDAGKRCAASQFYEDPKTGMVVFAIQVYPSEEGGTRVLIRMPLGLNLSEGVRLKLDTQPAEQHAGVATCLPDGCLVLLRMSNINLNIMKAAQGLMISATSFASNEDLVFRVSFRGFSRSIERMEELR